MRQRLLVNTEQLEVVKNILLFSSLNENEKDMLLKNGGIYSYPQKEYLFKQEDPLKYCYILCSGIIREFRENKDGRQTTISIDKAGDMLCRTEMFLQSGVHHTNAVVISDAYVMELPVEQFKANLLKYPAVASSLISSLAQFAFMKQFEIEKKNTMSSTQLVASFLRELCSSHRLDPRGFTLPYKKFLIASRLGIEMETFSRTLPKLKDHGITVKGNHVSFHESQADVGKRVPPANEQAMIAAGREPTRVRKIAYYKDKGFTDRSRPVPDVPSHVMVDSLNSNNRYYYMTPERRLK
jgi:CRP-like cAMP-binding protein